MCAVQINAYKQSSQTTGIFWHSAGECCLDELLTLKEITVNSVEYVTGLEKKIRQVYYAIDRSDIKHVPQ